MGILQNRLFTDANDQCLNHDLVDAATKERIPSGKLDIAKRLELAASVDPQHILSPQSGQHVRITQRALIRLRNARPITAAGSNMPESRPNGAQLVAGIPARGDTVDTSLARRMTSPPGQDIEATGDLARVS